MASITLVRKTMSTITVKLTGLQSNYNGNIRTCEWFVGTKSKGSMQLANRISQSQEYTITNLFANLPYAVKAVVTASGWGSDTTIGPTEIRTVAKFRWSSDTLDALENQGATTRLTYTEWNRLVDKVEEIKPDWNGSTIKVSSGMPIKASVFNAVAYQVGATTVNPGDICKGSYFIELANKVNSF